MREHVNNPDAEKPVADRGRQEDAVAHLNAHFGTSTPFSSIGIPESRAYTAARQQGLVGGGKRRKDKRGSNATIRRELTVLMAAANHARRWKRLTVMPSIERPSDEGGVDSDEVVPFFDKDVMVRLFAAAAAAVELCRLELTAAEGTSREHAARVALRTAIDLDRWMRLAYYTAARRRSIENLDADQIKLVRRQITLAPAGKRRTKKRQPVVPIFDEIMPVCVQLVAERPQGRVFVTASLYRPFMALCRSLDMPEPHHPHMIRHSRATHLLQDGKDIWDVAGLLGDTVATVQKTYGHHSPNHLRGKLQ